MGFAVFLDVDGVLNTSTTVKQTPYGYTGNDYVYLVSKLKKYGLEISGQTFDSNLERGKGIKEYLEEHSEIEEFVILDDMTFDFERYKKLLERLLLTNGIENVKFASRTPAVEAIVFLDYIYMLS